MLWPVSTIVTLILGELPAIGRPRIDELDERGRHNGRKPQRGSGAPIAAPAIWRGPGWRKARGRSWRRPARGCSRGSGSRDLLKDAQNHEVTPRLSLPVLIQAAPRSYAKRTLVWPGDYPGSAPIGALEDRIELLGRPRPPRNHLLARTLKAAVQVSKPSSFQERLAPLLSP